MTLGQLQQEFARLVGEFLVDIYKTPGYSVTFGECYRTPEQAALNAQSGKGIANSLHTKRLAIDLNLFVDGKYQSDSTSYKLLGAMWKVKHPLARWGGDFTTRPDGNHFSLEWEGVR